MAPDIASRIRAKLSRRRHSGTPSLASSRTTASDADSFGQGHSQGRGDGNDRRPEHAHSQLSRGDTASSQSAASNNRSWSLKSLRGTSQTHFGDDAQAGSLGRGANGHAHGDGDDKKDGDEVSSLASSGIGPLDVVRDSTKHRAQDVTPGIAATGASTSPAAQSSVEPQGQGRQQPPKGLTKGRLGNDLHHQTPSPLPSPRPGTATGLSSVASPSHLHSIHEDLSTPTPTSTENTENTEATENTQNTQNTNANTDTDTDGAGTDDHDHDREDGPEPAQNRQRGGFTGPLNVITFAPHSPTAVAGFHPPPAQTPPSTTSAHFPPGPLRPGPTRRQSLLSNRHSTLIKTLLHSPHPNDADAHDPVLPIDANMVTRKIWVKRPNASATIITINEDDLVDDVRDMILRKYANSLGRTFDAPDLAIRIHPREQQKDRTMGPEEPMGRTLDAYFPGGQTVEEALIIDIPRRTPKASPRVPLPHHGAVPIYYTDDGRPSEAGEGYFPPVGGVPSPHLPVNLPAPTNGSVAHSIAVLGTGHLPLIPSPGGTRSRAYRDRPDRPRLGRTHTSSPTFITNGPTASIAAAANHGMQHYVQRAAHSHSRTHSEASDQHQSGNPMVAVPLPNSPVTDQPQRVDTPPPRTASPRPSSRPKKKKADYPNLPPGMLNGTVPPISVLIVEDNPINLKLLEAFVKRLKVRWQTAMNGVDAVKKWRTGGFHLVLMDIQLPGMNGLDATREIRRLERVNSIGVFSSSSNSLPQETKGELKDQDRLENLTLFKSPVIIVALTASSLQSDRHDALAAGCNDFLTKPVNFVWLERKVMEWGCMQALIDFDGWRKWKDFSQETVPNESAKKASAAKLKSKKNRSSLGSST